MKWIRCAFVALALLAAASTGRAQSAYITDVFEVTLRTGPGIDHKIVAMLKSGQPLTIVESGNEWSRVSLPGETEGYVLSRFISQTPPARLSLKQTRDAYDTLRVRAAALEAENSRLLAENQSLSKRLETASSELEGTAEAYATLKSESSDFFTLKKRCDRAASELQEKTKRVDTLEAEVSRLQLNRNIRWFLGGAGVLVVGFLIGFSAKKQRRRSSLL